MLHGVNVAADKNQVLSINDLFRIFEESPYDFYLTGSRYFGTETEESDWDFCAQYSNELVQFLEKLGFVNNAFVQEYLDPMTLMVMGVYLPDGNKIDVQLCKDLETKLRIRDILFKYFYGNGIPGNKMERSQIWSMVYAVLTGKV